MQFILLINSVRLIILLPSGLKHPQNPLCTPTNVKFFLLIFFFVFIILTSLFLINVVHSLKKINSLK